MPFLRARRGVGRCLQFLLGFWVSGMQAIRGHKKRAAMRPVLFLAITRDDYWQTSTLRLSMNMPVGVVPTVLESETARKRTCTDWPA